jgi:hypothetical protein
MPDCHIHQLALEFLIQLKPQVKLPQIKEESNIPVMSIKVISTPTSPSHLPHPNIEFRPEDLLIKFPNINYYETYTNNMYLLWMWLQSISCF